MWPVAGFAFLFGQHLQVVVWLQLGLTLGKHLQVEVWQVYVTYSPIARFAFGKHLSG